MSLKTRALRYLSQREHSRLELQRKLARYAEESDDIDAVLDWLQQSNFLSQERFSESLVNRRAARFGNLRIMYELQGHALGDELTANVKVRLAGDEIERACQVLRKKFDSPPADAEQRAKQMRFLQQRGFSSSAIQAAIRVKREDGEDDTYSED
ncbi:recombination regulator RecX [Herbaspirillum sp. RTI4]|uniref:recombination regulator RecX n=1 Tax=Herbaspirillum sp. RTI4 TaxID=3048640 RepID=UPI002AB43862|nr:recombination regulator RecX [Herbaspirillum sp. RTI4]MDY7576810.1 recombination regulator RecX [Herbaspirillum sp. RTI4]MEA9981406.1 recombination regulator RecX [Herbaspirillum sp. RTI4]